MDCQQSKRLYDLMDAYREGVISTEEMGELDCLVTTDIQSCETFVWYVQLSTSLQFSIIGNEQEYNAQLEMSVDEALEKLMTDDSSDRMIGWLLGEEAEEKEKLIAFKQRNHIEKISQKRLEEYLKGQRQDKCDVEKPVSKNNLALGNRRKEFNTLKAIAACLVVGICLWFYLQSDEPMQVAKIVDSHNMLWQDPLPNIELMFVKNKEYVLRQGVAQIVFNNGAEILLEGPAKIRLESANGAYLSYGKLVANVPPKTMQFTVKTLSAQFIDMGTEFAIEAKEDGTSECHVFKGLVRLIAKKSEIVCAGETKRVLKNGQTIIVKDYNASKFIRSKYQINDQGVWPDYESTVLEHEPVAFWNFQNVDNLFQNIIPWSEYQANGASAQLQKNQLFENNHKVFLIDGVAGHFSLSDLETSPEGLTLVFHLWLDEILPQNIMWQHAPITSHLKYSRLLYLDDKEKMRLASTMGDDEYPDLYSLEVCDILDEQKILKAQYWHHIAIVFSKNWLAIQLFIDGALYCEKTTTRKVPFESDFSDMTFGVAGNEDDLRTMLGAINNVILFDTALSGDEIGELYQATH